MREHSGEIARKERFTFGANWSRFLRRLDEDRITRAEASLQRMLEVSTLADKKFLDIGCGSGLFSLAARRLGAEVHSFDYDPQSVACAIELRRRYFPSDQMWKIEEGSVLNTDYLRSLGEFDIVYAWGVLHHTGELWNALENAITPVRTGGKLFVAIYNDEGSASKRWVTIKRLYCAGTLNRVLITATFIPYTVMRGAAGDLVHKRNPIKGYIDYRKSRGMDKVTDWVDWLGGYPFEVARPEEVFDFCRHRGFVLQRLTTDGGHGNNQYVFEKVL